LLDRLKRSVRNFKELRPETLALNYIYNSTIIKFFEDAGVELQPFYKMLWQHVLAVELIKMKFKLKNEKNFGILQRVFLRVLYRNKSRQEAIKEAASYLAKWGDKFWYDTEHRVKEILTKIETELVASSSIGIDVAKLAASGASKLTDEQRKEIVERGQRIVSKTQINDLEKILELLRREKSEKGEKFYIVIDDLDENWVGDDIKFNLIQALLSTVRQFLKVEDIKVIVALRSDVLYTTIQRVNHSGFQREKYESNYLHMRWRNDDLYSLLSERIDLFFRKEDLNRRFELSDILPKESLGEQTCVQYFLDRSMLRPRYAILFTNRCIQLANRRSYISLDTLRKAEADFSDKVLDSICDEWRLEFPLFREYLSPLVGRTAAFSFASLNVMDASRLRSKFLLNETLSTKDPIAKHLLGIDIDSEEVRTIFFQHLIEVLYGAGVIGVRTGPSLPLLWSFENNPRLPSELLVSDTELNCHPAFWYTLAIKTGVRGNDSGL
jgi:hypothetical protein